MVKKNWYDFYQQGLQKEDEFAKLLVEQCGGEIKHSTRSEDINHHVDLIWTVEGKDVYFDVKGLRKANRSDTNYDDSIHWVEIQNVKGKEGWLYGRAHYIAFELNDEWLIVKRVDILKLIDEKVLDKTIKTSKELYTYYQRKGREDIIIKALSEDLKRIAVKVLSK